jgi:hypothetical protein
MKQGHRPRQGIIADEPKVGGPAGVLVCSQLDFFLGRVAATALPGASDDALVYLAQLLSRMARPESLFQLSGDGGYLDKAFCLQAHEAALEPRAKERSLMSQRAGDAILFYSGFFRQKIARDGIGLRYYFGLGRNAYLQAKGASGEPGEIFAELALRFELLSDCVSKAASTP